MRSSLLLLCIPTLALADRALPLPERAKPAKEEPCTGAKGGPLVGRYMCQLAIDGVWGESVPCEIVEAPKPREYDAYLRFSKWLWCDISGSLTGTSFDGAAWCIADEPNQIGHEALVEGKLAPIGGGFRMVTRAEMVKEYGWGPDDARKTRTVTKQQTFTLDVCRRPWPKAFKPPEPSKS
jgi:hypothetical protein